MHSMQVYYRERLALKNYFGKMKDGVLPGIGTCLG